MCYDRHQRLTIDPGEPDPPPLEMVSIQISFQVITGEDLSEEVACVFFFWGGGGVGDMNLSGIDKKKDIESMGMWRGLHTTTARDSWKSHKATVPRHLKISRAARCDLHILQAAF